MTTESSTRTPLPRLAANGLDAPTGDDVRRALRRLPAHDAEAVWDRACDRAGVRRGAHLLDLDELERLGAALLEEPGEVGLVGRALTVRTRSYRSLAQREGDAPSRPVDWGRQALELLLRSRPQDPERLREIARLDLFRPEVRERLDRACRELAARFGQDAGLVTLVLDGAQALAGSHGVGGWLAESGGTPVEWSLCATTVRTREAYVVPDLAEDLLQRANPLATDEDAVRCYAGAPLITSAGHVLGALCTIGGVPRDFCAADVAELQARADALVADLERACAAAAEPQAPAA